MRRPIKEPVTTVIKGAGSMDETSTSHPAFAQIGVSRVSGYTALYDSDFKHNHYMVLRINKSTLRRSLNRDWHYDDMNPMIEVAMSESQWATMISSLNAGSVPCTLESFNRVQIPGLPEPVPPSDLYKSEIKEDLAEAVQSLEELEAMIESLGLPKGKAAQLMEKARNARTTLTGSIPWVIESSDKHMEKTVERGKQEIHGWMNSAIHRAGIEALGGSMPLQIDHKDENEEEHGG